MKFLIFLKEYIGPIVLFIVLTLAMFSCSTPTEPEPQKFELKLHICGIDSTQCRDTTIN